MCFNHLLVGVFFTPKKTLIHNSLPGNNRLALPPASQGTEFSSQTFWCENFSLNKQRNSKIPHNKAPPPPPPLFRLGVALQTFRADTSPHTHTLLPGHSPAPVELCPSSAAPWPAEIGACPTGATSSTIQEPCHLCHAGTCMEPALEPCEEVTQCHIPLHPVWGQVGRHHPCTHDPETVPASPKYRFHLVQIAKAM